MWGFPVRVRVFRLNFMVSPATEARRQTAKPLGFDPSILEVRILPRLPIFFGFNIKKFMTYYEELTKEVFKTTAIYLNRIKDKAELESLSDLKEDGRPDIEFLTKDKKIPLVHGYIRIVYGYMGTYLL